MASAIGLSFRPPAAIRASAVGDRAPAKRSNGSNSTNSNWWAPIFGWGGEPDYITGCGTKEAEERPPARKFAPLTEEKARELRMKTMEMETFQDAMYHSAIASRLACDPPRRNSSSSSSSSS